jgi:hypothetical protein
VAFHEEHKSVSKHRGQIAIIGLYRGIQEALARIFRKGKK